jgi:hypothetical protein
MPQKRLFLVLLGGLLAAAVGCSRSKPVQVLVTLDGKPVEGATVALSGDAKVETVSGFTGPDGTATLNTSKGTGVPPGEYKVLVTKVAPMAAGSIDMKNPDAMRKMAEARKGGSKGELPAVYADSKSTPLTLKVPPESSPAKLELKSKP